MSVVERVPDTRAGDEVRGTHRQTVASVTLTATLWARNISSPRARFGPGGPGTGLAQRRRRSLR
jgi:hypothetical protein